MHSAHLAPCQNVLLYADDDSAQLLLRRALFEDWGYRVCTANSGEEACVILRNQRVDVVVLDYNMPGGMDGGETACAIRETYPAVPIVLYTGEIEVPRRALRCVSMLVRKADDPESLREALMALAPIG